MAAAFAELSSTIAAALGSVGTEETVAVGLACLCSQIVLWFAFTYVLPAGPWTSSPGFSAHQVVVFPLMIYMTYMGFVGWFGVLGAPPTTVTERVLGRNPTGEHLAQFALCELLLWDIPTGLFVKALRDPVMVAHHVGMLIVAYGATKATWSYYAIFFFGTIEASGIFLTFVDLFHPKNREWTRLAETHSVVGAVNNVARGGFVVAYMAMRACYFPYVVLVDAIPDCWAVLHMPLDKRGGVSDAALWVPCALGVAFCVLQEYWALLIIKQIRKALRPKKA